MFDLSAVVLRAQQCPHKFIKLPVALRVCPDDNGDAGTRMASTELLEQGTQAPSRAHPRGDQ